MIIVDTGPIVALINSRDQYHLWARSMVRQISDPMVTCDAVLSEALFLVSSTSNGISRFADIMASGAIQSDFSTAANVQEVASLIRKYQELPMSFADACLVRLSEIHDGATLLTIDSHFHIYRKNGAESIPVFMPA